MLPDPPQASATDAPNQGKKDLDALLRQHRPTIEGFVRRKARTREDAEDLIQNICLKAARYFPDFRHDCPFSQWLLRIAVNEIKNYYRRLAGERWDAFDDFDIENVADLQQSSQVPCPDQDTVEKIYVEKLKYAMEAACSADEKNVMLMVYQGESFEEIAETLDLKGPTVRSHFLRGRTKLLAHLVAFEPDMVGGDAAIERAAEKAQYEMDRAEIESLKRRDTGSNAFRSACAKLARHVELPAILLAAMLLEVRWNL